MHAHRRRRLLSPLATLVLATTACRGTPPHATTRAPDSVTTPTSEPDSGHVEESRFMVLPRASGDDPCPGQRTINRRFLPMLGDTTVVVETVDSKEWRCVEGTRSTVTLAAWPAATVGVGTPMWTYTGPGESGQDGYLGGFYRVRIPGCCGPHHLYRYISLESGKARFEASGPMIQMELRRTVLFRFATVEDNYSAIAIPEAETDSTVVAAVMYGPADGPIQRAILRVDSTSDYRLDSLAFAFLPTPERPPLADSIQQRLDNDPREIRDVAIVGRLVSEKDGPTLDFQLPILADKFDVAHARLSPGMYVKVVSTR